jgi:hypothetical protein
MRYLRAFVLGVKESRLSVTTSYKNERILTWYDYGRNAGEMWKGDRQWNKQPRKG